MKRPQESTATAKGKWVCPDKDWGKRYPTVAEFMCDGFWEDGKPREVSSLTIRFDVNSVSVSLSDHAMQRSCFTTADSLEAGLGLLDEALRSGRNIWRPWKASKK